MRKRAFDPYSNRGRLKLTRIRRESGVGQYEIYGRLLLVTYDIRSISFAQQEIQPLICVAQATANLFEHSGNQKTE